MIYKCGVCGKLVDHILWVKDYNGNDDCMKCPACGGIETGFAEVEEDDDEL